MGALNALIGAAGAREGARTTARATEHAADLTAAAAREATEEQRRQFDLSRADLQPWMQQGATALGRLGQASTGDMSQFFASPDYNFRRAEGTRDIGNSFAARGGAASGNALRALSEYNQNMASGEFGNWWNRQAGLAGVGQSAVNQSSNLGATAAGNIAGINTNAAGNIGNYMIGGANARASGIQNATQQWQQSNTNSMNMLGYFMGGGFGRG